MATATLLAPARAVFYDANGNPLSGGLVHTYIPSTTTAKVTWQDAGETIPNANPVVLDSAGSCLLYGSGGYQITVTDALGNAIPAYSGVTADLSAYSVVYLPPFTGGVATTVTAKLAQTVSVKDFGATGNGTTDDTAAVRAAITAVGNGGTILIPTGTYLLSSTLAALPNQQFIGAGANNTILTRTGNYGDTLAFASGGAARISGLWFSHATPYTAGATSIANLATTGAHLHLVNGQFAIIENCMFWRMPYSIHIDHCTITTIRKCWLQGTWDPLNAGCQEGIANIWLDNASGNNEIIAIENIYITGSLSAVRSITWTASDGSATNAALSCNIGSQYGVWNYGTEDLAITDSFIGANSTFGIYSLAQAGAANLDWRISNNMFDSAGNSGQSAQIYFGSASSGAYTDKVTITGNVFNGELVCLWGIVSFSAPGTSALTNFTITGNSFDASVGSCIYLSNTVGGVISGNSFTGYNSLHASAGADYTFSAAVYGTSTTTGCFVSGNSAGGQVNSDVPGGYAYNSFVGSGLTQFGNFANGITLAGGAATGRLTVIGSVGNYAARDGDQIIVATAANTTTWSVVFPASVALGRVVTIKDNTGGAATHNIVFGGTLDGSASYAINTNYGFVTAVYNGVQWNRIAFG